MSWHAFTPTEIFQFQPQHMLHMKKVLYINSTHNFYTIIAQPDSFIINLTKNLIDMFINTDQMLLLSKCRFDHLVRLMMKNFQA